MLRCISVYCIVSTEAVCVLAHIRPIEFADDEHEKIHNAKCWMTLRSRKALRPKCDEKQITLYKWEELFFGEATGE